MVFAHYFLGLCMVLSTAGLCVSLAAQRHALVQLEGQLASQTRILAQVIATLDTVLREEPPHARALPRNTRDA